MSTLDIRHMDEAYTFHNLVIGVVKAYGKKEKKLSFQVQLPYLEKGKDIIDDVAMMMPYAGKDHGGFARPEIGDQVVVGFYGRNHREALILGCIADKDSSVWKHAADKNEEKLWLGKSGMQFQLWDEAKKAKLSILIGDVTITIDEKEKQFSIQDKQKKNNVLLDMKNGELEVSAKNKIKASCGKSKLEMDASQCVIKTAKLVVDATQIELKGKSKVAVSGQMVQVSAAVDAKLQAKGQMKISANGITSVSGGVVKLG